MAMREQHTNANSTRTISLEVSGFESAEKARAYLNNLLGGEHQNLVQSAQAIRAADGTHGIKILQQICCFQMNTPQAWYGTCSDQGGVCVEMGKGCVS